MGLSSCVTDPTWVYCQYMEDAYSESFYIMVLYLILCGMYLILCGMYLILCGIIPHLM